MITLDSHIGNRTGWLGLASFSTYTTVRTYAYIAGYPADLIWGALYLSHGRLRAFTSTALYYLMDTEGGSSGSGIFTYYGGGYYAFGVHRGYCRYAGGPCATYGNMGPRITSSRFSQIVGWLRSGY